MTASHAATFQAHLFDLQINGFAGVDFQQDGLPLASLNSSVHALAGCGCTRFLATLVTDAWPNMVRRLRHLRCLRSSSQELTEHIAGWHLEGPFLSEEAGYHGAHNPRLMINPTRDHIQAIRAETGTDPVMLTLAPERDGALEAIRAATQLGMTISLGHTNASQTRLAEAVAAGATAFTHLGNACPQTLDRHDNILWRVLDTESLLITLIPDTIHVSPPLFRLIHKAIPFERIIYVSDAMAAAGAPPGRYQLGSLELEVGADQVVRQPGRPNFAGSALRPDQGLARAGAMLGVSPESLLSAYSTRPAALLRIASNTRHVSNPCNP